MTRIGVTFRPQNPPEDLLAAARAVQQAGLDELWLWEDCFLESGIAAAVAALGATEGLRVGIGLMPVPLRNVALTAMEVATVSRLFPDRLIPVLGHGVQEWMGQVGARVASPLGLLEEYVGALRRLLAGEQVTVRGRYVNLDQVGLGWPPPAPPPLLVGATKSKTFALAGRVADGTVLVSGVSPAELVGARAQIGAGPDHQVVQYLATSFGAGADERLADEGRRYGWAPGADRYAAGNVPAVAAAVRRWVEAGADTVVLEPTAAEPDLAGFIARAGEVRALVLG